MKRNTLYLILIAAFIITSCNDNAFLERKPIDFLAPDNFKTEKDIREAVNGIYKAYISDITEPIKTDFMVDNGFYVAYLPMWSRSYNSETNFIEDKWKRNYKTILRANTVLFYIDNVPLSEAVYNQHKGEAKFLRALAYFDLVEFFGDVPLRTEPESLSQKDKPLTSKEDLITFVYSELEEAGELLPPTYPSTDRGRATKGAAWAILARAYLYNEKFDLAIDYCRKVKDLNIYSLMPQYENLFLPEYESTNTETIFDMQFEKNALAQNLSNSWYTYFTSWAGYQVLKNLEEQYYTKSNGLSINDPNNTAYDISVNPNIYFSGSNLASQFVLNGGYDNRFSNRDPRLYATIVVPYSIHDYQSGTNLPMEFAPIDKSNANFTSFRARKYVDYSDQKVNSISGVNPIIIRYADILLMEAEALVEGGAYDEMYVRSLINEIRQRPSVMMPTVEDVEGTVLSQPDMRQIIRHERRVEFALEGLRYLDVKRWDEGAEAYSDARGYRPTTLKKNSAVYEEYVYLTRTFDPSLGYYWPIPKSEIDSNKALSEN